MESKPEIGIITGNFDLIHPGYVKLFREFNDACEYQFVLLQEDPTIERPEKLKPVLSVEDRKEIIENFFVFPIILSYNTEEELYFLLKSINPDIRFLGDDYINKPYTGDDLGIPVHYFNRSHGWSTTKFKTAISNSISK